MGDDIGGVAWPVVGFSIIVDRKGLQIIDALKETIIEAYAWARIRGALVNQSKSRVECLTQLGVRLISQAQW